MPPSIRQTNFSGGELCPHLWGRTDLDVFGRGLRTLRNFFTSKQGAAVSRPGTTFVSAQPADAGVMFGPSPVRLLPFVVGDDTALVVVVGFQCMRFMVNGAMLLDPGTGQPYKILSPYVPSDFASLQWAQVGDVLTITSPNWDPFDLRLFTLAPPLFALTQKVFTPYQPYFVDLPEVSVLAATTPYSVVVPFLSTFPLVLPWAVSSAYALNARVFVPGASTALFVYKCIQAGTSAASGGPTGTDPSITDGTVKWAFVGVQPTTPTADFPAQEWIWLVSAVVKDNATGNIYETLSQQVTVEYDGTSFDTTGRPIAASNLWAVYPGAPITLARADTAALLSTPPGYDSYTVLAYNFYRGRGSVSGGATGGVYGFVGQSAGTTTASRTFVDNGQAPDYTVQPLLGTSPLGDEFDGADTRKHKDRPSAVTYFQQRLVFGGAARNPMRLDASATDSYQNFDLRFVYPIAGEALRFNLASRKREKIRSYLSLDRLLAFTNSSVWNIGGPQGAVLDFNSIDARVVDEVGTTTLQPLAVDGTALFVRAKGTGVRALTPTAQDQPYQALDVSEIAQHLFLGVGRAVIDWTYAEDPWGVIWAVRSDGMLLSLSFSKNSFGWAHHDTQGYVEAVCAIPEGDEDAVYLSVRRVVNGQTVRYLERMTSRLQKGVTTDPATNTSTTLPNAGATFDGTGLLVVKPPDFICLDSAKYYLGPPVQVLTGLGHLAGKSVYVIGPGRAPAGPLPVTGSGTVDLGAAPDPNVTGNGANTSLLYVGLGFTADLETLDVAEASVRMRKKIVERVGFEVDTAIGLKTGQDFDHLSDWEQLSVGGAYLPISASTTFVDMAVDGEWGHSARMVMRQPLPLPVTVLGVTREIDIGS